MTERSVPLWGEPSPDRIGESRRPKKEWAEGLLRALATSAGPCGLTYISNFQAEALRECVISLAGEVERLETERDGLNECLRMWMGGWRPDNGRWRNGYTKQGRPMSDAAAAALSPLPSERKGP